MTPQKFVRIAAALALAFGASTSMAQNVYMNSGKVLKGEFPFSEAFSEAVKVGGTLYLSGQIGLIPGTTNVAPGGIKAEAKQTMENVKTSLEANG